MTDEEIRLLCVDFNGNPLDIRAERTCHNTSIEFECSECGASCAGYDGYYNPTIHPDEFKYCPNCGRKVVDCPF